MISPNAPEVNYGQYGWMNYMIQLGNSARYRGELRPQYCSISLLDGQFVQMKIRIMS